MKTQKIATRTFAATVAALALFTAAAVAQDATVTMTPEQQARLNEAQVREAEAKARQAENAANPALPTSGISGEVKVGAATGQVEGAMLSAASIVEASRCIASRFREASSPNPATGSCPRRRDEPISLPDHPVGPLQVLVVADETPIDVTPGQIYRVRLELIRSAFEEANTAFCANPTYSASCRVASSDRLDAAEFRESMQSMDLRTGIGAAVSLLSFLRSNYEFGGVTVTGQDDAMLATAVAGQLVDLHRSDLQILTTQPMAGRDVTEQVDRELRAITAAYRTAKLRLVRVKAEITRITAPLNEHTPAEERQRIEALAEPHSQIKTRLELAISTYEDFMKGLFEGGSGTAPGITAVLRALALMRSVGDGSSGVVLWLNVNNTSGGYYSQTNVLTWLGANPMHYAGGSVVSYRATWLGSGAYLEAGVLPIFAGYVGARDLRRRVSRAFETSDGTEH